MAKKRRLHLRNTHNRNVDRVTRLMINMGYSHYKTLKIVIAYGQSLDCFDDTQESLNDICEIITKDIEGFKYFIKEVYRKDIKDTITDMWYEYSGRGMRGDRSRAYVNSFIKKYHKDIYSKRPVFEGDDELFKQQKIEWWGTAYKTAIEDSNNCMKWFEKCVAKVDRRNERKKENRR